MALREGLIKATIILVPTYLVAYYTEKMVYVIPMLAAVTLIATSLFQDSNSKRRVEEDARKDGSEVDLELGGRKDDGN